MVSRPRMSQVITQWPASVVRRESPPILRKDQSMRIQLVQTSSLIDKIHQWHMAIMVTLKTQTKGLSLHSIWDNRCLQLRIIIIRKAYNKPRSLAKLPNSADIFRTLYREVWTVRVSLPIFNTKITKSRPCQPRTEVHRTHLSWILQRLQHHRVVTRIFNISAIITHFWYRTIEEAQSQVIHRWLYRRSQQMQSLQGIRISLMLLHLVHAHSIIRSYLSKSRRWLHISYVSTRIISVKTHRHRMEIKNENWIVH